MISLKKTTFFNMTIKEKIRKRVLKEYIEILNKNKILMFALPIAEEKQKQLKSLFDFETILTDKYTIKI